MKIFRIWLVVCLVTILPISPILGSLAQAGSINYKGISSVTVEDEYGMQQHRGLTLNFSFGGPKDYKQKKHNYRKGELIVRFKDGELESQVQAVVGGPLSKRAIREIISDNIVKGAKVHRTLDKSVPGLSYIKLPKGISVEEARAKYGK